MTKISDAPAPLREENSMWKGSLGDEWIYSTSRWKAKMEIPVYSFIGDSEDAGDL